jgi:hypothetical protein
MAPIPVENVCYICYKHKKYKGMQFKYVYDSWNDIHTYGKAYVKGPFIHFYHDKI